MGGLSNEKLIVLGCDPGSRHIGIAVLGQKILLAEMWPFERGDIVQLCSVLNRRVHGLVRRFGVDMIAIEGWEWHGAHTRETGNILMLTGAVASLSSQVLVEVGTRAIRSGQLRHEG